MMGKFSQQLLALLAMLLLGNALAGCYLGQRGKLYLPPPETKQAEQQPAEQQPAEQKKSESFTTYQFASNPGSMAF